MNLTQLTLEVRARLGETIEDFWKDTDITRALNEAIRRFLSEDKWFWLYTTNTDAIAVGDDTLLLPEGVTYGNDFNIMISSTQIAAPIMLIRVSPAEGFFARRRYWNVTGYPRWYYIESSATTDAAGVTVSTPTIRFVPTTSTAMDVEYQYIRGIPPITAGTDTPDIPEEYHGAIVAYATAQLWMKELTGGPKAQEQMALYQKVLKDAISDQRDLANDEVLAWGKEEPELIGRLVLEDWVYGRLPASVGH